MVEKIDWDTLDYNDLTQRQRHALDAVGNVGRRSVRPGESSLSIGDQITAEEVAEETPSGLETGFGPREYNPQQRYQTRFTQRSGDVAEDQPSDYENLERGVAMGRAIDPEAFDRDPGYEGGQGDARGGYDMGAPSMGQSLAARAGVLGVNPMSLFGTPLGKALSGAATTSQMGYGFGPGFAMGLKSSMMSPMDTLSFADKALGEGLAQRGLNEGVESLGLSEDDVATIGDKARTGSVESMTPADFEALSELNRYTATPRRASLQALQGLRSMLGFGSAARGTGGDYDDALGFGSVSQMSTDDSAAATQDAAASFADALGISRQSMDLGPEQGMFSESPVETEDLAAIAAEQASRARQQEKTNAQRQAAAITGGISDAFGESVAGLESTFGDPMGVMGGYTGLENTSDGGDSTGGGFGGGDMGGFGPSAAADVAREEGRSFGGGNRGMGGMGGIGGMGPGSDSDSSGGGRGGGK